VFEENVVLDKYAGPGRWNDPDILQVGIGGMGDVEYRTQFSLWSIMAAPLLVSADLRKASPATLEILRNKDVIAIDQDALGIQGKRVRQDGDVHVIVKPLANGDRAVAVFNGGEKEREVSVAPDEWEAARDVSYIARDLWTHGEVVHTGALAVRVAPHATQIYRIRAK
jgi:alpha-galactosidase